MYKIAVLSFYSGIVERGVETFAYEMGKRLSKKHQVTIFQSGNPVPFQKFKTIQIKAFGSSPKFARNIFGKLYLDPNSLKILFFSFKCLPKIFKGNYNFIIVLNGGWETVIFKIASKFSSFKIIIPGEAGIGSDDAWNLMLRPDAFVALTTPQQEWASKLTPEVNVVKIPNGVDISRFNPKIKAKKLPLKKPIVVCTSALDSHKRVNLTIKAASSAKMSLLVLGDGQMRGSVDSLGKRLLGKNYLRLSVPYEQIPSYYKAADVFTLASKTEAFGISYIEAMACNLPVVTTSDDSRAEIIGRAGILTNPTDTKQYAKDLKIAIKTDYRNLPYDQALKFSWNKIAEKYLKLLKSLE